LNGDTGDTLNRYDAALQRLPAEDRDLIVARLEMQRTYDQIASTIGASSAAAARAAVCRAMCRLAEEIDR
jgi:RNA polymerase sigma-70 factor, ECF subfamily